MNGSRLDELTARARKVMARADAGTVVAPPVPPTVSATSSPDGIHAPSTEGAMVVLGIDPGLATTGYGVVVASSGTFVARTYGVIETTPSVSASDRLAAIYDRIQLLLRHHRPDAVAVERLFFGRNVTTAMAVGQARGVILLAIAQADVPIAEYTPLEVKSALAGYGRAPKAQMQRMVQVLLSLDTIPRPDDAADGLALALTHVRLHAMRALIDATSAGT